MPELPLVSIVVPAFNGEAYLPAMLQSLVAQTYPRLEILLMDDASTDETGAIAARYGERIRYHRQPATRGQFLNVNDGIARAAGELIGVYHADDIYEREIVTREVDYLRAWPDVGVVFAKDTFVDSAGQPFGRLQLPPELRGGSPIDYPTLINALLEHKNRFLRAPSSMVRASIYRELGGYHHEFGIASDLEMWLRIARGHRVGIVDEYLFRYRRGHGGASELYEALRAEPERYFEIMDLELQSGGRRVARPHALAAFEAHRAEDHLKRAVASYVLGDRQVAREVLASINGRTLLSSGRIQRGRMIALLAIMRGLVRLPRLPVAASALRRRLWERPFRGGFVRLGAM
jgi:glycosyltransferase involved in cell wall biosynthesis